MTISNGTFYETANGTNGTNSVNGHTPNLQEIHDLFIELAEKAGETIMRAHPLVNGVGSKKNSADLVTETDQAVENMISAALMAKYPHYEFLGEETYKPGMKLTDAPTFVIDPIDGTINFVHSFPNSCVSLGFCIDRRPVVGVVFNPFTKILYSAISGKGAFMNQKIKLPLKGENIEPLNGLSSALVGVEWGSDRSGQNWQTKIRTVEQLGKSRELGGAMVHSMRSMGSAALDFCAVAAGTLDIFWECGIWAWDVCAGWVILTEAGGIVAECTPGKWEAQVDGRKYVAVRASPGGEGQKEMVEELWANLQGEFTYPN